MFFSFFLINFFCSRKFFREAKLSVGSDTLRTVPEVSGSFCFFLPWHSSTTVRCFVFVPLRCFACVPLCSHSSTTVRCFVCVPHATSVLCSHSSTTVRCFVCVPHATSVLTVLYVVFWVPFRSFLAVLQCGCYVGPRKDVTHGRTDARTDGQTFSSDVLGMKGDHLRLQAKCGWAPKAKCGWAPNFVFVTTNYSPHRTERKKGIMSDRG